MEKYFPYLKKGIVLATPFLIVFTDIIIKLLFNKVDPYADLGVLLSAMAIVQLFPFVILENNFLNKALNFKSSHRYQGAGGSDIRVVYEVNTANSSNPHFIRIKEYTLVLFTICIIIFLLTVVLSARDVKLWLPLALGAGNCLLSWTRLILG